MQSLAAVSLLVASLALIGACSPHYVIARPAETPTIRPVVATGASGVTRNVVLVSVDGLRPDAIAHFQASNLQRLIREGSYSLAARTILPSTTLPSHTSMLSGEPPDDHGVLWNNVVSAEEDVVEFPTIFSVARSHGYRTAAFFSKAKFRHLESWSERRRKNAAYYDQALADVSDVVTPYIDPNNVSIFNQYTLRVQRRDELQQHLNSRKIGNAIYYPLPLHLQPCFAYLGYKEGSLPIAEQAAREVISIPVFPELTRAQQDEVVGAIRDFYQR